MRSIERNFEEEQRRDPNVSDYLSLYRAVKGKCWSENMIRRWFRKLVDREEYKPREAEGIIQNLLQANGKPRKSA